MQEARLELQSKLGVKREKICKFRNMETIVDHGGEATIL
jgi:hypothetical protein